ncbi:MAG: helix-hairpin-helix domain-containing protein [Haloarculaceae archaeon]
MGLLDRLRSLLGSDDGQTRRRQGGSANVTVEHEPDTASEAAVKGTGEADDNAADGADAAAAAEASSTVGSQGDAAEPEGAAEDGDGSAEPEGPTDDGDGSAEPEEGEPGESDSDEPVDSINGIGPTYAERLEAAGIETVGDLAAADPGTVAEAAEAAESRATDWVEQARVR